MPGISHSMMYILQDGSVALLKMFTNVTGGKASDTCVEEYCKLFVKRDMSGILQSKFLQNTEQLIEDMMADTKFATNPFGMTFHQFFHPGSPTKCGCMILSLLIVRGH